MPFKKILGIKEKLGTQLKKELKEFEEKVSKQRQSELKTEIIVSLFFVILSGGYIAKYYGLVKLEDALFFWMFPASIMIFLTLIAVFLVERAKKFV